MTVFKLTVLVSHLMLISVYMWFSWVYLGVIRNFLCSCRWWCKPPSKYTRRQCQASFPPPPSPTTSSTCETSPESSVGYCWCHLPGWPRMRNLYVFGSTRFIECFMTGWPMMKTGLCFCLAMVCFYLAMVCFWHACFIHQSWYRTVASEALTCTNWSFKVYSI